MSKKYFLFILVLLQFSVFAQTDWVRWKKSDPSYQKKDSHREREFDFSVHSTSDAIVQPIINAYWFFISDVDGDNCPFHPSCSEFLFASVKETNLIQGTLMFFDRFTRDTNFYGRLEHYPRYGSKYFYDPVTLYALNEQKIQFIPAKTYVDE